MKLKFEVNSIARHLNFKFSRLITKQDRSKFLRGFQPLSYGFDLIRLGGDQDGGYLLPDDLVDVVGCLSLGVATNWKFEQDLGNLRILSHMYDGSVEEPQNLTKLQKFFQEYVGLNISKTDTSLECATKRLLENTNHRGDLIMQMDIEGDEYLALSSLTQDMLLKYRIIIIEFHNFHLFDEKEKFSTFLSKIFSTLNRSFYVAHFHPNNASGTFSINRKSKFPKTFEITYHRLDRISGKANLAKIPNKLDCKNVTELEDINVNFNYL
jgi:hypothetical protein